MTEIGDRQLKVGRSHLSIGGLVAEVKETQHGSERAILPVILGASSVSCLERGVHGLERWIERPDAGSADPKHPPPFFGLKDSAPAYPSRVRRARSKEENGLPWLFPEHSSVTPVMRSTGL